VSAFKVASSFVVTMCEDHEPAFLLASIEKFFLHRKRLIWISIKRRDVRERKVVWSWNQVGKIDDSFTTRVY
jgi:hypothetical protein